MKSYFKKEMALLLTLLALTAGCGREAPPAEEGKIPVAASEETPSPFPSWCPRASSPTTSSPGPGT